MTLWNSSVSSRPASRPTCCCDWGYARPKTRSRSARDADLGWRHYRATTLNDIELFEPGHTRSSLGASTHPQPPDPPQQTHNGPEMLRAVLRCCS
jgi:hypothetical protein